MATTSAELRPEEPIARLLVLLSRVRPEPELVPSMVTGIDLERFVFLAGRLGNFNLIARRLLDCGAVLGAATRSRLERNLGHAMLRERFGLADVRVVAARLRERGSDVLLLKGGAYTRWIYPRPGLRHFVDLDVLVKPEVVDHAVVIAQELGYAIRHRIEGAVEMVRPARDGGIGLALEIHTHLVHHHEYPFYRAQLGIDEGALLEGSEARDLDGVQIRVLSAAEELVYSVIHFFFHHDLAGLKYHSDINALLTDPRRPLDVQKAVRVAIRMRAAGAVGLALEVNQVLFGAAAVPRDLLAGLRLRGVRRRLLAAALPPLDVLPLRQSRVVGHPVKALVAPGLLGPLKLGFRWLFPGRRYLDYYYQLDCAGWRRSYHLRYAFHVLRNAWAKKTRRAHPITSP